jgi:hypothetical protein
VTLFIHRNAGGRCPCGAENATCGPPSSVVPVDQLIEEVAAVSGPLKKYRVTRGGVETVMKLSDADAARLGVTAQDAVGAASTIQPVEPVGDGPDDADGTPDSGDGAGPAVKKAAAKRRPASANKARTPAENKAADGGS